MTLRIHDGPPGSDRADVGAKLVQLGRYAIFAVVLVGSVVAVILLSPVLLAEAVKDGVSGWAKREREAQQTSEPSAMQGGVAKVILSKLAEWGSMPLRAIALVVIASIMGLAIVAMLPLLGATMIRNSLARHAEKQRQHAASHMFLAQP